MVLGSVKGVQVLMWFWVVEFVLAVLVLIVACVLVVLFVLGVWVCCYSFLAIRWLVPPSISQPKSIVQERGRTTS